MQLPPSVPHTAEPRPLAFGELAPPWWMPEPIVVAHWPHRVAPTECKRLRGGTGLAGFLGFPAGWLGKLGTCRASLRVGSTFDNREIDRRWLVRW